MMIGFDTHVNVKSIPYFFFCCLSVFQNSRGGREWRKKRHVDVSHTQSDKVRLPAWPLAKRERRNTHHASSVCGIQHHTNTLDLVHLAFAEAHQHLNQRVSQQRLGIIALTLCLTLGKRNGNAPLVQGRDMAGEAAQNPDHNHIMLPRH